MKCTIWYVMFLLRVYACPSRQSAQIAYSYDWQRWLDCALVKWANPPLNHASRPMSPRSRTSPNVQNVPSGKREMSHYNAAQLLADILEVATVEFAEKGLSGARVDEIARLTRACKRMIYYHFDNWAALYLAVLERAFLSQARSEAELHLDDLRPDEALRKLHKLVGFSFDFRCESPGLPH